MLVCMLPYLIEIPDKKGDAARLLTGFSDRAESDISIISDEITFTSMLYIAFTYANILGPSSQPAIEGATFCQKQKADRIHKHRGSAGHRRITIQPEEEHEF
jgi:hypothetical protein